ncbi:rRNA maturation RNase YbeY [Pelagibacteraceae bacterium]|jgi:probable rRNA maturation factor|nr:rRNA maturation RNase YbeY [Pelagibacteraceae bacterium]MDC0340195.1 rRNA maturation RNase YbeY [Pelagibacteraceae bacterium]|tara:strand:+ start:261 stop:725 length:465 start_codon:yes stop_codon:yes gene_type:complete
MIKINVISNNINWTKYLKDPNSFIGKKIKLINNKNKLYKKNTLTCSLLLTETSEIKKFNKKFRNKNKSTDVLSFPFYKKDELKKKIRKEKEVYLGDIVINLKKIKNKNNKFYFINNLNKLWIHGLVHLFGHRHKKDKDYYNMKKIEDKYLEYIS